MFVPDPLHSVVNFPRMRIPGIALVPNAYRSPAHQPLAPGDREVEVLAARIVWDSRPLVGPRVEERMGVHRKWILQVREAACDQEMRAHCPGIGDRKASGFRRVPAFISAYLPQQVLWIIECGANPLAIDIAPHECMLPPDIVALIYDLPFILLVRNEMRNEISEAWGIRRVFVQDVLHHRVKATPWHRVAGKRQTKGGTFRICRVRIENRPCVHR